MEIEILYFDTSVTMLLEISNELEAYYRDGYKILSQVCNGRSFYYTMGKEV